MNKKFLKIMLCAVLISSLTACGQNSADTTAAESVTADHVSGTEMETTKTDGDSPEVASAPQVTLVYAEVNPLDTTVGKIALKFKETVEELSEGSIQIDIQAGGILGAEGDVLDSMIHGEDTIDMARVSVSSLTGYNVPKNTLLAVPYEFVSREHFWRFAKSDIAQELLRETREQGLGLTGLFYGEEGFRHIFSSSPISGLDDLKGLKIRVSTDPTMVALINALGAEATVVSYNKLYTSLETGVVDGAENPINNYQSNGFNEVAKNLILDGHQLGVIEVIITDAAWGKLTNAQKECMRQAADICAEYNEQIVQEGESASLSELREQGVNIVEVEDKTPWIEACREVIAQACQENEDIHERIQELK